MIKLKLINCHTQLKIQCYFVSNGVFPWSERYSDVYPKFFIRYYD